MFELHPEEVSLALYYSRGLEMSFPPLKSLSKWWYIIFSININKLDKSSGAENLYEKTWDLEFYSDK